MPKPPLSMIAINPVLADRAGDRHPGRIRLMSWILGWGDLRSDAAVRSFVRTRPFVSLRPADSS